MTHSTYESGLIQSKAYRALRIHVTSALSEFDLSMPQWALLGQLYERRTMRLAELAQILDVEPPLVTTMIDSLAKKGLVTSTEDPSDRRAKLLVLTKKGLSLIPEVEKKVKDVLKDVLKGTTPKEIETYLKVLSVILSNSK